MSETLMAASVKLRIIFFQYQMSGQLKTDKMGNKYFLLISGFLIIILSIIYINIYHSIYGYVLSYIGIVAITYIIPDNKYLNPIKIIILFPSFILMLVGPLMKIFSLFMFSYLIPAGMIVIFFKYVPKNIFNIDLSYSANVYLSLTSTFIFVTLFCEKLLIFFNKVMNGNNPEELVDNYNTLTLHLINRARTKYLIFFFFFGYIIIYSISSLNSTEIFEMKNTNVAIMQTFGTYVAFDRLISNRNLFIFEPRLFFNKMYKIWDFDFQKSNLDKEK